MNEKNQLLQQLQNINEDLNEIEESKKKINQVIDFILDRSIKHNSLI